MASPQYLRVLIAALLLFIAGCSSSSTSTSTDAGPATSTEPAGTAAPPAEGAPKIDINAVRETARTAMFVPAPSEFQAALKASGADIDIRKLVVDEKRDLTGKSSAIVALETGVRLANVLLTASASEKDVVLARMAAAREGLVALGASEAVMTETDKVINDFKSGAISGKEVTPALDVLARNIQEQLKGSSDPNTATLVQAGGWLQGAHLLSSSLAGAADVGEAPTLLRQPTVLAYFMTFLESAGGSDPAVASVLVEMGKLKDLAGSETLGAEQMTQVAAVTGTILKAF